ncbi:MAG TPA: hypothetical protein VMU61_15135 [Candidatus Aquilonibacter sp.]|nr:hypothetical protein [Candidatus Aquilonibacter sp.]
MKLTTGILAMIVMTGGLWAQNPNIINNVQNNMNAVQQKKTHDSDAALQAAGVPGKTAKPAPVSTPQAKPAPGAKSATAQATKPQVAAVPVKAMVQPHDPMTSRVAHHKSAHARPVIVAKKSAASPATKIAAKPVAKAAPAPNPAPSEAIQTPEAAKAPKPEDKKWAMTGKRDPFFSPVVQQPTGSGCSTGKKCLEIGQINLRGVVQSDSGFIAVVTNNLNKAYFLRENDPVFNGYVVKITGDSVVFQETVQDKLGKPFTREVVKRLFTPAV